jgi:DNA/RNA-binding domain of Phe-tRNA-synthetase-like protein
VKYRIDPAILASYPGYLRGVLVLSEMANHGEQEDVVRLLREAERTARERYTLETLRDDPKIASWREAFMKFGTNPNRYPPSIENLLRRVLKGGTLPYINTPVALMNTVSLRHGLPCGGDDLGKIEGDLVLTYAQGDEWYIPLNGTEPEPPQKGEIILRDSRKVLCRKWTWRQGDATKITESTVSAVINIDCLPPFTLEDLEEILAEASSLFVPVLRLSRHNGCPEERCPGT